MNKKIPYSLALGVLLIVSFLTFRSFIDGQNSPYASEIAAAFLGALLTVIVTSLLLGQQSKSEEAKEKNVEIYKAKLETYKELMNTIEEIVRDKDAKSDSSIRMQFQAYRTKFIADKNVVFRLTQFAKDYCDAISEDSEFDDKDWQGVKDSMERLVDAIKADLEDEPHDVKELSVSNSTSPTPVIPTNEATSALSQDEKKQQSLESLDFTPKKINREEFLSNCATDERAYFLDIFNYCESKPEDIILDWGTKGVSIKDKTRKQFLWMFPIEGANSKSNINLRTQHFTEKRPKIEIILRSNGIENRLSWRPADLPFSEIKKIIELVCEIEENK